MENRTLYYFLALKNTNGIGDVTAKKMLNAVGAVEGIFKENPKNLIKITGVGQRHVKALNSVESFAKAEQEIQFINNENIQAIHFLEQTYPQYLKHCVDGPVLIFVKGCMSLNPKRIISIVGTRHMTNYGKAYLETFVEELKKYNPVIISGLAYGVDILAHQLAVQHDLETVGVLAHGCDRIYPKKHEKTANRMLTHGGWLTEFCSGTNPDRENFVKRNRIVAGLSQATIVIESAEKGGSLITAQLANSYHRDVFALPGRVTDKFSKGCNHLIKTNQASLLQSAKDLAYLLNWDNETSSSQPIQKELFVDLNKVEQQIYNYLERQGQQSLDNIALNCQLPIHQTATYLLNLELKGVTRPLPGKMFEVV